VCPHSFSSDAANVRGKRVYLCRHAWLGFEKAANHVLLYSSCFQGQTVHVHERCLGTAHVQVHSVHVQKRKLFSVFRVLPLAAWSINNQPRDVPVMCGCGGDKTTSMLRSKNNSVSSKNTALVKMISYFSASNLNAILQDNST